MKRAICLILALLLFTGCRGSGVTDTPELLDEPTATAPSGETEPDVLETPAEESETPQATNGAAPTADTKPNVTAEPNATPAATEQNSGNKTDAPSITPTPNGGVEMPRVPLT